MELPSARELIGASIFEVVDTATHGYSFARLAS
jgi:hypothetical protein